MLNFLVNNTPIIKLFFLAMGLIAMSTGIYNLTYLTVDLILKLKNSKGHIEFRPFGYFAVLIFMSGYLLHAL